MANRILRDWTDSDNIEKLSFQGEVFFTRLFMKADDYGCFHANPKLLKAALFPLKDIKESDVVKYLNECHKYGIITIYESGGKKYLQIINFGQRLRAMKSRFPTPDSNSLTIDSKQPLETETETETETEKEGEDETETDKIPSQELFLNFLKEKVSSEDYMLIEKSAILKYSAWVENGWKNGYDKKIKNWKSTLLNTIPFLEKEKSSAKKENNYETNKGNNARIITEHKPFGKL